MRFYYKQISPNFKFVLTSVLCINLSIPTYIFDSQLKQKKSILNCYSYDNYLSAIKAIKLYLL